MALNIKNARVELLAKEISELTGESKTEAIRKALEERRQRLAFGLQHGEKRRDLLRFLEEEIWPRVPAQTLGKRLTREEEEAILGFGDEGA